jgi:uncharacterized membrane protein
MALRVCSSWVAAARHSLPLATLGSLPSSTSSFLAQGKVLHLVANQGTVAALMLPNMRVMAQLPPEGKQEVLLAVVTLVVVMMMWLGTCSSCTLPWVTSAAW